MFLRTFPRPLPELVLKLAPLSVFPLEKDLSPEIVRGDRSIPPLQKSPLRNDPEFPPIPGGIMPPERL